MKSVYYVSEFERFSIYLPESAGYKISLFQHEPQCAPIKIELFKCDIEDRDKNSSSNNEDLIDNFVSACKLESPHWKPIGVEIYSNCLKIEFVDVSSYDPEEECYQSEFVTFNGETAIKVTVPRIMHGAWDNYMINMKDRFCRDCEILIREEKYGYVFSEWKIKRHSDEKYYAHYEVRD